MEGGPCGRRTAPPRSTQTCAKTILRLLRSQFHCFSSVFWCGLLSRRERADQKRKFFFYNWCRSGMPTGRARRVRASRKRTRPRAGPVFPHIVGSALNTPARGAVLGTLRLLRHCTDKAALTRAVSVLGSRIFTLARDGDLGEGLAVPLTATRAPARPRYH